MPRRLVPVILSGAILVGVAGCVSPEELRRQDEAACLSYGFTSGTTGFAGCLQRESLARRYRPEWRGPGPWYYGPGWYPPFLMR